MIQKNRKTGRTPCTTLTKVLDIKAYLFPLPILAAIILTATPAMGGIYTYVDENGTIHFTNVPTDPQFKMIIPPKKEEIEIHEKGLPDRSSKGLGELGKLIVAKSHQYGLDPALIKAVIAVESDFNPRAVSIKGARGLMQLMPMTASELGVSNPFDPEANIDGGTRYLRYLLDYFNWDIDMALAAYHSGMMRVVKHTGVPPIPATQKYIKRVKSIYNSYILQ